MKILIIGSGGYVASTVLPALSSFAEIHVGGKTHISAMNLARQYGVKFFDLNKIKQTAFDLYFVALPTYEAIEFIKQLPKASKVWLEKPLTELCDRSIRVLDKTAADRELDINCGLLRRSIPAYVNIDIKKLVYKCNVPMQNNWKSLQLLGALWVDGVHAIDLMYTLNRDTFQQSNINIETNRIKMNLENFSIDIFNHGQDTLLLNDQDYSNLLTYKYSQKFLRKQVEDFMTHSGNYLDVLKMQAQFIKLLKDF